MSTEKRNDEIDLIEVTQKAGKALEKATVGLIQLIIIFFKGFIHFGITTLRFTLRYSLIIFGLAIIGYFVGLSFSKMAKPYYRTSATIQSNTISNANLINYINRLHELLLNNDNVSLAKELNINVTDAAKIYGLKAFLLSDKDQDGIADEIDYLIEFTPDTISNVNRTDECFQVQLLIYDPEIVNQVQDKLEAYLLTYPRIQQISAVNKLNLRNEMTRLDKEIKLLDSLRLYEYFVKEKELREFDKNTVKLNQLRLSGSQEEIQPTRLLHEEILTLFNQNLENYRAFELETEPFIFLSKFIEVTNPVNVSQENNTSLRYSLIGLFLGLLISLLLKYKKEVFQFIRES